MTLLELPFYETFKSWGKYPQYFDKTDYWLQVVIILLIALAAAIILAALSAYIYDKIDNNRATKTQHNGLLIDKKYIGEYSTSGTGTAVVPSTNGGVGIGVVSTSSHADEQFIFFVKSDKVYKIPVDMQNFYSLSVGDKIKFNVLIGGLSKKELSAEI